MKQIIKIVIALQFIFFLGIQTINAQYPLHNNCLAPLKADNTSNIVLYGPRMNFPTCIDPGPIGELPPRPLPNPPTETPFNFEILFNDLSAMLVLESLIDAAQREAVNRWLNQQEEVFRQEINQQLNTNHNNFKDAQRDFFKHFEDRIHRVNATASSIASELSEISNTLQEEQTAYNKEMYYIKEWRFWREWCGPHDSGLCNQISAQTIRGTKLENVTNDNQLRDMWEVSVADFARTEYNTNINRALTGSLIDMINNDYLLDRYAQYHINYYNSKSLEDRVFLMMAYLTITGNNISAPFGIPINRIQIPKFWDRDIINQLVKDNLVEFPLETTLFGPGIVQNGDIACRIRIVPDNPREGGTTTICQPLSPSEQAIREGVLQEHMEFLSADARDKKNKLCGSYNWRQVGNSNTVTITGLRIEATREFWAFGRLGLLFLASHLCVLQFPIGSL